MSNQVQLCKMVGGSHAYGLNTPASDIDYRGVYVNTEVGHIIGLSKENRETEITKTEDKSEEGAFFEFRHFMGLLRKTNTMVLEILFNKEWLEKSDDFDLVLVHRYSLLDSDKFYKSLRGYMQNEARLAFGERTGTLGSQRKLALEKHGYSPKNIVNLLRLCSAGSVFFNTGDFPVKVGEGAFKDYLMKIKTQPETFTVEALRADILDFQTHFESDYLARKQIYKFDESFANYLCKIVYKKYL